jgi:hypothetical protein
MTRTEQAVTANYGKTPTWFVHSQTPDKPPLPAGVALATLTGPDYDRFQLYMTAREDGVLASGELANMTPELSSAVAAFEDYLASTDYEAWATLESTTRELQWRLYMTDVINAIDAKATVPPGQDPGGVGTGAPGVPDIGTITPPTIVPISVSVVSTGGPSPQIVFGDDGDIVTVN